MRAASGGGVPRAAARGCGCPLPPRAPAVYRRLPGAHNPGLSTMSVPVPKAKPVFSGIEALRPDTSGWNLVVKVRGPGPRGQRDRRRVGQAGAPLHPRALPRGWARPDRWDRMQGCPGSGRPDGAGAPNQRRRHSRRLPPRTGAGAPVLAAP